MPSKALRHWTLPRRDLAAGGSALVRLSHPLLPVLVSARPGPEGLVLGLEGARPVPLGPLDDSARRAYLARLGSLAGFLSFHGLGIAAEDVALLGAREGDPDRPALGAPPAAAWRAIPPALVVAGAALRLAGREVSGRDGDDLRRSIERGLGRALGRGVGEDVLSALRAADARARPESLVGELARRGRAGRAVSRDLLGLAFPAVSVPRGEPARPAVAVGPGSLWLARGAARRDEPPAFVECAPGSALEEGGALRRLARALDGDPRADLLETLANGARTTRSPGGPPVALVAVALDRWAGRSRRAFEEQLPDLGFRLLATRAGSLRPWEEAPLVVLRMSRGDAASLLWLPFASMHDAVAAWREAEAAAGETDAARFLDAAHALAARFEPAEGRLGPARARPAPPRRPGPVLEAAALLASGFGAAEAAAAAGVSLRHAEEALLSAAEEGALLPLPAGAFTFRDEREREKTAARVPASGRRDAVARLEAAEPAIRARRLAVASLARADADDVAAARRALDAAVAEGDSSAAGELLSRAPAAEPDLGRPLFAVRVLERTGRPESARAAARRITAGALASAPLDERIETARTLVRLREEERALALCPGGGPGEDVARALVLVEARRDGDARRVLERARAGLPGTPAALRLRATLLGAELHERAHDYAAAGAALAEAEALLPGVAEEGIAREMARTAGYLANDLGRTDEAIALFRRAEALSRSALERADSTYDVAYAALDGGRFEVAARELESALALYAASGHEERYLSALGNRIDLLLGIGDFPAARDVLERVLAHERAGGRDHQVLFALASLQELSLLDGDEGAAAAAFREAEERGAASPRHPVWREILLLEAERLLAAADPEAALGLLARAGELPDNSARTEARRLRLVASASRDAGRPLLEAAGGLSPEERALLGAEGALASSRALPDAAIAVLERLSANGAGAGAAVRRVLEWSGRFPAFFATSAAGPLVRLAGRIAARAGLTRAEERFSRLLEHGAPPPEIRAARTETPAALIAEDPGTRELFAKAARVARSSISVLLLGESGTGKEIVARELHRLSGRRGPFLAVNVAALPGTLAEAELFGHARGAFTGADRERRGLVEASSGGTLFLDEIGDLPLALQGKLLRVLQEGEVRRLGETAVRRVDLRVLAATHRPLKAMAEAGSFRIDLYFRLAGLELELSPLRERPRDLARLIDAALEGRATLTREAAAALRAWPWPGNVRELLAALEAAAALAAPGPVIGLEHLPRALRAGKPAPSGPASYQGALRAARLAAIDRALQASRGNRTQAARALGISRQSLLYEIKKLEIDAPRGGR